MSEDAFTSDAEYQRLSMDRDGGNPAVLNQEDLESVPTPMQGSHRPNMDYHKQSIQFEILTPMCNHLGDDGGKQDTASSYHGVKGNTFFYYDENTRQSIQFELDVGSPVVQKLLQDARVIHKSEETNEVDEETDLLRFILQTRKESLAFVIEDENEDEKKDDAGEEKEAEETPDAKTGDEAAAEAGPASTEKGATPEKTTKKKKAVSQAKADATPNNKSKKTNSASPKAKQSKDATPAKKKKKAAAAAQAKDKDKDKEKSPVAQKGKATPKKDKKEKTPKKPKAETETPAKVHGGSAKKKEVHQDPEAAAPTNSGGAAGVNQQTKKGRIGTSDTGKGAVRTAKINKAMESSPKPAVKKSQVRAKSS